MSSFQNLILVALSLYNLNHTPQMSHDIYPNKYTLW